MTWLTFVLLVMATARITRLITADTITSRMRFEIFKRYPPKSTRSGTGKVVKARFLGQLVDCPWCCGVWVSGVLVAVVCQLVSIPLPGLVWPAIAELAALTSHNLDR